MKRPAVDIVILSNAKNDYLHELTYQTIKSALEADGEKYVFVLEQNAIFWEYYFPGYTNIVTIGMGGEFNYNKFANFGASFGTSEYICIANNDLIFHSKWWVEMCKSIAPVCSPWEPNDKRQHDLIFDSEGFEVGRHFSGWCFVISRWAWNKIGGFDEEFAFWCADNSVVEQVKSIGLTPKLVRNSIVHHLGSQTLKTVDNRDDLTVKMVRLFNKKYKKNLFGWGV